GCAGRVRADLHQGGVGGELVAQGHDRFEGGAEVGDRDRVRQEPAGLDDGRGGLGHGEIGRSHERRGGGGVVLDGSAGEGRIDENGEYEFGGGSGGQGAELAGDHTVDRWDGAGRAGGGGHHEEVDQ